MLFTETAAICEEPANLPNPKGCSDISSTPTATDSYIITSVASDDAMTIESCTPTEVSELPAEPASAEVDLPEDDPETPAEQASTEVDIPEDDPEIPVEPASAEIDLSEDNPDIPADSASTEVDLPEDDPEIPAEPASTEVDLPEDDPEIPADSASTEVDLPEDDPEIPVEPASAEIDLPEDNPEIPADSASTEVDLPEDDPEIPAGSASTKVDLPEDDPEIPAEPASTEVDLPEDDPEIPADSVSTEVDLPEDYTEIHEDSVSTEVDLPEDEPEIPSESATPVFDNLEEPAGSEQSASVEDPETVTSPEIIPSDENLTPSVITMEGVSSSPAENDSDAAVSASNPNYMVFIVGDSQTIPDPYLSTDYSSITFETNGGLDVIIKGVNEENREQLQTLINEKGWLALEENNVLEIHLPTLLDVEKYSTSSGPYDKNLCWAAAASNLLWASGYAQNAVNPATGESFVNADEVFDYFRHIFTDNGGLVDGAVSVFMAGDYPYDGEWYTENGWSHLAVENADALLPETDPLSVSEYFSMQGNPEKLKMLEEMDTSSFSLSLGRITDDSVSPNSWTWDDAFGHAVTAVGLVYDSMVTNIRERFKAIFLADSDNTPCNGSQAASENEKAEAAASSPNTYSMYRLTLKDFGDQYGPLWVIDNYPGTLANGLAHVAIRDIFVLHDNEIASPAEPEQAVGPTPQPEVSDSHVTVNPSVAAPKTNMFTKIKQMMTENNWLVYSPADWRHPIGNRTDFEIYFHASLTFLEQITLDENPLTYQDYSTKNCRNGLFLLTIRGALMKTLEAGEHTLTVKLKNSNEITMQIFVE